jgi:hypothetical protein
MLTYETTDRKEAQRCRLAQFNGRFVTLRSEGSTVAGPVLSVKERKPSRWLITVVPKRKVAAGFGRTASGPDLGHPEVNSVVGAPLPSPDPFLPGEAHLRAEAGEGRDGCSQEFSAC